MKKKKREFKVWYIPIIILSLYIIWISMALADLDGNPLGVNNGKIETYIGLINHTGHYAYQFVELYKVDGNYSFAMRLIEDDFANLDEYESKLEKYGVVDREDIKWKLVLARTQLESARIKINSIILEANYPELNNLQLQEMARELEEKGILEPSKSFILE